jgi:hypothetical protein
VKAIVKPININLTMKQITKAGKLQYSWKLEMRDPATNEKFNRQQQETQQVVYRKLSIPTLFMTIMTVFSAVAHAYFLPPAENKENFQP